MYSDSDSDDYCGFAYHGNGSSDDDGSDYEDCRYCDATYKLRNRQRHMETVHKCPHCNNYMPKTSIPMHIENKHLVGCAHCNQRLLPDQMKQHVPTHFVRCQYCNENVLKPNVNTHIADRHPFHATIGMIRKVNDAEFNRLVTENRIYAKDGHIFIK